MEEHDVFADAVFFTKIKDMSSSKSALGPRPVFLTKCEQAVIGPVVKVLGAFNADAILGGMKHDVFVIFDKDTDVFAGFCVAEIGPGFEVV